MWHIFLVLFFVSVMLKHELLRRVNDMDDFFHYPLEQNQEILQRRQNFSGFFRMKFEFEVLPIR